MEKLLDEARRQQSHNRENQSCQCQLPDGDMQNGVVPDEARHLRNARPNDAQPERMLLALDDGLPIRNTCQGWRVQALLRDREDQERAADVQYRDENEQDRDGQNRDLAEMDGRS